MESTDLAASCAALQSLPDLLRQDLDTILTLAGYPPAAPLPEPGAA